MINDDLLRRARSADREAWKAIFDACYPAVVEAVRLDPSQRAVYDPADFANEAFHRLLVDFGKLDFATMDDLIAHLVSDVESLVAANRREVA